MSLLAPHLLLRTDGVGSRVATLLRGAGYIVSSFQDDDVAERIAAAPHIDAAVIELPMLAALPFARRIAGMLPLIVITPLAEMVKAAVPHATVVTPIDVGADLVSAVDLAIASSAVRQTG